jgi:hypothetical protein
VIVNVLAFLLLGHERTTAMAATNQTRESKLVFDDFRLACKAPVEDFLYAIKEFG